ncbi:MAG: nodulation protein NfeD [Paramuribaculum sp.]|nr:nodulation protein NfeD [Paramuribaculum sp.]
MIRKASFILTFIICSLISSHAKNYKVYVLPIKDEINSTTWQHTKNGIKESKDMSYDLLLVHLNTYGGTVVHADSIRTALLHAGIPTVAFIDNNAASAGALIALACDSVYMRPDATMGAVTVVSGNDGTQMPDKYQSYMRAMMRSTAERHGKGKDGKWRRNPLIAEAMVDSRIIVPGLIDSTKVLTFTPDEALEWHYAEGKAENIDDVLSKLNIDNYTISEYEPSWIDYLLGFFTNPVVQSILIMIIIGGIYFELQTPGMGFPSLAALTAAILYFLPLYLTGIASSWIIILFVVGLILLLIELFVIPGFGIAGVAGIALMIAAIFMGLLENFSFTPGEIDLSVIWKSLLTLIIAFMLAGSILYLFTSKFGQSIMNNRGMLTHVQKVEDGYIGVDNSLSALIGESGIALTDMRPSGKIGIGENRYDGVSVDGFILAGQKVKVVDYINAQLYVKTV